MKSLDSDYAFFRHRTRVCVTSNEVAISKLRFQIIHEVTIFPPFLFSTCRQNVPQCLPVSSVLVCR